MKKWIILLAFCGLSLHAFGQSEGLTDFNQSRKQITKTGMLVLGSWAVGNMAVSGLMMTRTSGSQYYFHQMNVFWNVVNLGLAGFGYYNALQMDPAGVGVSSSVSEFYSLQKTLLFNAGLDIAYIAGGLYLLERAKNAENKPERLRGFGRSVILQGAFLLAFDTVLFFVLDSRSSELLPLLNVSADGIGLRLRF
jgi:hypothetical protein